MVPGKPGTEDGLGSSLTETTMLTFLTSPKPFRGHIGVIQRNAIQSWKLVHPDAEVILFGGAEGAEEAARELGVRYAPQVKRNALGTPYLASILDGGRELSGNPLLCYVNCDIILLPDFRAALERLVVLNSSFLMAGQRWDTEVKEPLDFSRPDWQSALRQRALTANSQRAPRWIDYFVFSRDLYAQKTPPLVIGRAGFDNWMLWYARSAGARVIDASQVVVAVHQNHDYSHHPEGEKGIYDGEEARQNFSYMQGGRYATLENATHRLTPNGLRPNYYHWVARAKRKAKGALSVVWFGLLNLTRPLRRRLGMRQRHSPEAPR
jgi:hypothetical protein